MVASSPVRAELLVHASEGPAFQESRGSPDMQSVLPQRPSLALLRRPLSLWFRSCTCCATFYC